MTLRVFKPHGASNDWADMTLLVTAYWEEHGHLGVTRAQATAAHTDPHRADLYTWLEYQRTAYRNGDLEEWQISFLNAHGMLWNPAEANRDAFITYAEECARECGGLAVSVGYTAPDGTKTGERLKNYRHAAKNQTIDEGLRAELSRIDPNWNPQVALYLAAPLPDRPPLPPPGRKPHPARRRPRLPRLAAPPR
ncbi:helicase associated domain-containing protein [Streptomyces sp. NPDC005271]|uniref:helicase associated domain-containing protein n=1 Tax=unclassified Streptomyces TaxID=2593676 RepID=UPI0033AEA196